jgi:hypothetical protein
MAERWIEYDRVDVRFSTFRHLVAYLQPFDASEDFRVEPHGDHEVVILQRATVRGRGQQAA